MLSQKTGLILPIIISFSTTGGKKTHLQQLKHSSLRYIGRQFICNTTSSIQNSI